MNKKLKRKIVELCGLKNLSQKERLGRANEILNSIDLKQAICHQILGCTHKDVEQAMLAIKNEKQLSKEQLSQLELEELAPEKFEIDLQFKVNKEFSNNKKEIGYRSITKEECAILVAASKATFQPQPSCPLTNYPTYTREQVQDFMREHREYKERENEKREECLTKMTESEVKTEFTMRPLISTKD